MLTVCGKSHYEVQESVNYDSDWNSVTPSWASGHPQNNALLTKHFWQYNFYVFSSGKTLNVAVPELCGWLRWIAMDNKYVIHNLAWLTLRPMTDELDARLYPW